MRSLQGEAFLIRDLAAYADVRFIDSSPGNDASLILVARVLWFSPT